MKNFSILALVAATMAFTSEAIKVQAAKKGDENWPYCDDEKQNCDKNGNVLA